MMNLTLFFVAFSISLFIGFFINKYSPSYFIISLYHYIGKINIKYIFYINLFLNIIILFNYMGDLDFYQIMQMADSSTGNNTTLPIVNTDIKDTNIPVANDINNNNLILNEPKIKINIPQAATDKLTNGLTFLGGAKIGLELAKNSPHMG